MYGGLKGNQCRKILPKILNNEWKPKKYYICNFYLSFSIFQVNKKENQSISWKYWQQQKICNFLNQKLPTVLWEKIDAHYFFLYFIAARRRFNSIHTYDMGKISIKLVNKKILPFGKLRMRYANFRDIETESSCSRWLYFC